MADDTYPTRKAMSSRQLIDRALADLTEIERRQGRGGALSRLIEELLSYRRQLPDKGEAR